MFCIFRGQWDKESKTCKNQNYNAISYTICIWYNIWVQKLPLFTLALCWSFSVLMQLFPWDQTFYYAEFRSTAIGEAAQPWHTHSLAADSNCHSAEDISASQPNPLFSFLAVGSSAKRLCRAMPSSRGLMWVHCTETASGSGTQHEHYF